MPKIEITDPDLRLLAASHNIPLDSDAIQAIQKKINGQQSKPATESVENGTSHYSGPQCQGYPHDL